MFRAAIVAAIAGLILWQSQCFQVRDGIIINRCGLWQWTTGTEIRLARSVPAPTMSQQIERLNSAISSPIPSGTNVIGGAVPICSSQTPVSACTTAIVVAPTYHALPISGAIAITPYRASTMTAAVMDFYDDPQSRLRYRQR